MAKKKGNRQSNYQAPKKSSAPTGSASQSGTKVAPPRPSQRKVRNANLSWWLLGGGIVGIVALVIVLASVLGEKQTGETNATDWDLPSLDIETDPDGNGRVTLAEFRGTPVVLNFFASWCISCDRELPLFRQAIDDFGDDVQILFINSNETGNWRPMLERGGVEDEILVDDIGGSNNNGLYRSLGGTGGMPLTAFYDAEGNVFDVFPGEFDANRLYSSIESLIEEG